MKVAVSRAAMIPALERVATVVPTSSAVPILTYVRLDAGEYGLRLYATDLSSAITVHVQTGVGVKEPGTALMPANHFLALLRSVTVPVVLSSAPEGLLVRVGTHTRIYPQPVEDFPETVVFDDAERFTLPRADLLDALRLARPAASTSAFGPRLRQVALQRGKVLAADGTRYHEIALADTDAIDVALPMAFVDDVIRLLAVSTADTVEIGLPAEGGHVVLRDGPITLSTACLREEYPDVAHALLIPAMANTQVLRIAREPLVAAVRRVRAMADPGTQMIKIDLGSFDHAEISARQRTGAWASETVPAAWDGTSRALHLNHEHLLALLALFDSDMIDVRLGPDAKHKASPALIQEGGRSGVIMQLRADWHG